ncbi:cytokine-dependent hematopoietic cell linker isoform X2 [Electrophorus electricus]|nr:cytokine-dependent hematopoietic cell linker isoform X2 [Electrophorus electricus]XP_035388466.1 cytokine-dependent hematopoietic cell linker isoform X2 [Electrophorus electricus]XP_035388469.1 cytokine-dependent hematopoietic cell linker isoform X2 [Electrophorus electricus]
MKTWASESGAEDYRKAMDLPPQLPRRAAGNIAPLINRDLKPGRRPKITTERRSKTLGSNEPNTIKIPPRPVKSFPRDQGSESYFTDTLSQNTHAFHHHIDSPPTRPPPNTPFCPATNYTTPQPGSSPDGSEGVKESRLLVTRFRNDSSHRHSLDLESHDLHQSQSKQRNTGSDSVRKHHEWPQVKADSENRSYTGHSKPKEVSAEQDWYVGAFSRAEAEHALHLVNQEGAFLVRDCSRNTTHEPFVLAVFYDNRVFNIQIRFCMETCKYTLGTRIKTTDTFDSVADIIKFHSIFPIMLIDGRNPLAMSSQKRHCILVYPVTIQDMNQLLS